MIADLLAFLVATFLLAPVQSTLEERLAAARAPAAVVAQVEACANAALPGLVARATAQPWWALSTAFGAWAGTTPPEAVLRDAAPECAAVLGAARPTIGT